MSDILISVVTPVYGCADCLKKLHARLVTALTTITDKFEIVFVNDASPDGAWGAIRELAVADRRVRGIDLSRNYGQHIAITAGLSQAKGDWIVVMDCDLQDRPEEIPNLYRATSNDCDMVLARRVDRKDTWLRRMASTAFYELLSYMTDTAQDSSIANFGIYSRKVIDAVLSIRESHHYFPVIVRSVGFRIQSIDVEHAGREIGKSSYNMRKMLKLALDSVLSYSDKPLRLTVGLGLTMVLLTSIAAIFVIIASIMGLITVAGWASVIFTLFFLSGLIIMLVGVVGLYVGKTFIEAKKRPAFFIRETV